MLMSSFLGMLTLRFGEGGEGVWMSDREVLV